MPGHKWSTHLSANLQIAFPVMQVCRGDRWADPVPRADRVFRCFAFYFYSFMIALISGPFTLPASTQSNNPPLPLRGIFPRCLYAFSVASLPRGVRTR